MAAKTAFTAQYGSKTFTRKSASSYRYAVILVTEDAGKVREHMNRKCEDAVKWTLDDIKVYNNSPEVHAGKWEVITDAERDERVAEVQASWRKKMAAVEMGPVSAVRWSSTYALSASAMNSAAFQSVLFDGQHYEIVPVS